MNINGVGAIKPTGTRSSSITSHARSSIHSLLQPSQRLHIPIRNRNAYSRNVITAAFIPTDPSFTLSAAAATAALSSAATYTWLRIANTLNLFQRGATTTSSTASEPEAPTRRSVPKEPSTPDDIWSTAWAAFDSEDIDSSSTSRSSNGDGDVEEGNEEVETLAKYPLLWLQVILYQPAKILG